MFDFDSKLNAQKNHDVMLQGTSLVLPISNIMTDSAIWQKFEKNDLMKVEKVICSNKGYEIISFKFVTKYKDDTIESKVSGNYWKSDCKRLISNMKSGDGFRLEGITAKAPDGKTKVLRNVVLVIE